ncbi:MAG: lyase [Gemmatimonadales bacterium]
MRTLVLLLLAPVAWWTLPVATDTVDIKEWRVPFRMNQDRVTVDGFPDSPRENTRPRDPFVDQQHRVWFCGQAGNYIAYLEPSTGEFRRFEIDEGTHPHNLIVAKDGYVWYSGNTASHIGRLDPKTGDITKFVMPDPAVRDPHTLIFNREGDIWFTAQRSNVVGKLVVKTGKIHLIEVPTPRARPYGIVLDSHDRPWIALFGTNKIATVDPETMILEEISLPRDAVRPRRIAVTSDDMIWYVDYAGGRLGQLDPSTRRVREWLTPAGSGSRPYAMASDDKDRLWFVESPRAEPSRLVGFDPAKDEFFGMTILQSGGITVRHMVFYGPARELWFGTDANTIARARVP